jgi:hypothetical protein
MRTAKTRGFGPENSDGLARPMVAGAAETMAITGMGFYEFAFVECRHMVFTEYKNF